MKTTHGFPASGRIWLIALAMCLGSAALTALAASVAPQQPPVHGAAGLTGFTGRAHHSDPEFTSDTRQRKFAHKLRLRKSSEPTKSVLDLADMSELGLCLTVWARPYAPPALPYNALLFQLPPRAPPPSFFTTS